MPKTKRFKRRYKRYKKKFFKKIPRRISINTIMTKLRFKHQITTDATSTGYDLHAISMYNPQQPLYRCNITLPGTSTSIGGQAWSAVGDAYTGSLQTSLYSMYGNMYDLCKVCGISIKFKPDINVALGITSPAQDIPHYIWYDQDNIMTPTAFTGVNYSVPTQFAVTTAVGSLFSDYYNCKSYSLFKPFKRYIKCPKVSYASTSGATPWTSSTTVFRPDGFYNTASPPLNGVIYFFGKSLNGAEYTVDSTIGLLELTYYVKFKNRV